MGILELIQLLPKRCWIRRRNRKKSATSVAERIKLAEKEFSCDLFPDVGIFCKKRMQGGIVLNLVEGPLYIYHKFCGGCARAFLMGKSSNG